MADLFDLDPPPKRPAPPPPEPPRPAAPIPRYIPAPAPPRPPRPGLVASFSCHCGAQSEVREPCPESIPCWSCSKPMHRWTPHNEPPVGSAEVWDGEKLVRGR